MLSSDVIDLRCGAFQAMRLQNPWEEMGGESYHGFTIYRIAAKSPPLVHIAMNKRAEIVLFGEPIQVVPPVRLLAGTEFTLTADRGDDRLTITRIQAETAANPVRKQCTLHLTEALATMADMGAGFADLVDLIRKLEDRQGLTCPVRINVLPDSPAIEELAQRARTDPGFLKEE
jgi:hypothetical protein